MADVAITEFLRQGVRMLLEALVAQKQGPVDAAGTRHGLGAFAPLLQSLLGALAVLCGFTHGEEVHNNAELLKLDEGEVASILAVTGVCVVFLTNCGAMQERQVAMIYIAITWQYVLTLLPPCHPLLSVSDE